MPSIQEKHKDIYDSTNSERAIENVSCGVSIYYLPGVHWVSAGPEVVRAHLKHLIIQIYTHTHRQSVYTFCVCCVPLWHIGQQNTKTCNAKSYRANMPGVPPRAMECAHIHIEIIFRGRRWRSEPPALGPVRRHLFTESRVQCWYGDFRHYIDDVLWFCDIRAPRV